MRVKVSVAWGEKSAGLSWLGLAWSLGTAATSGKVRSYLETSPPSHPMPCHPTVYPSHHQFDTFQCVIKATSTSVDSRVPHTNYKFTRHPDDVCPAAMHSSSPREHGDPRDSPPLVPLFCHSHPTSSFSESAVSFGVIRPPNKHGSLPLPSVFTPKPAHQNVK